jgi:bile acid:Na+ symporter, BASS family
VTHNINHVDNKTQNHLSLPQNKTNIATVVQVSTRQNNNYIWGNRSHCDNIVLNVFFYSSHLLNNKICTVKLINLTMLHVQKWSLFILPVVVIVALVLTELTTTTVTLAFTVTEMMTTKTSGIDKISTVGIRFDKRLVQIQQQRPKVISFLQMEKHDDRIEDDSSIHMTPENGLVENERNDSNNNKLDDVLSKLTTGFPFFVLSAAIIAILKPQSLLWVNNGSIISFMLALVMCGTGLTLEVSDFTSVLKSNFSAIPLGILCQFCIMPIAAFIIGLLVLYYPHLASYGYDLFIGLILVGCAPGGTASNLVTLIAHANVALSVLLTTCSTMMAVLVTPFLVTSSVSILRKLVSFLSSTTTTKLATTKVLSSTATVGSMSNIPIQISGVTLCMATAKVVFVPVLIGMILRGKFPLLATIISRFTPFASVLLVSLLCGGVVAQNVQMLQSTASISPTSISSSVGLTGLVPSIIVSVIMVHTIGFMAGYIIPRFGFQQNESTSRTISIEVGMQNSALAVVLARSIPGLHPIATLPGAFSATVHSCLGSILATIWRRIGISNADKKAS